MSKYLVIIISILSLIFGFPTTSNAATDGCPDSWKIDLSQYPNSELMAAKQKLGFNMVETSQKKVVSFKGPLGDVPKLDKFNLGIGDPLSYLYFDSQAQVNVKVEVKDCPRPGNFLFSNLVDWFDKSYNNFKLVTANEFVSSNVIRFSDFKAQEDFLSAIEKYKKTLEERSKLTTNGNSIPWQLFDARRISFENGFFESGRPRWSQDIYIFSLTPNCLTFIDSNYVIKSGIGKCNFAIGYMARGATQNVYLFEPFTLDFAKSNISITCIKGKTTKKVSGTNPKCPKGYKVKA